MNDECQNEYRIFKFVTHDWEGDEFASIRKGAPMYGLFEIYRNDQGEICGRSQHPVLIVDMCFEKVESDPVALFQKEINLMTAGIQQPILEEPYDYAESNVMTEEESEAFIAGCALPKAPGEQADGKI